MNGRWSGMRIGRYVPAPLRKPLRAVRDFLRTWIRARRVRLNLAVLAPGETRIPGDADFVYAPTGRDRRLDADALDNALLSLSHEERDFVLVSRSLRELPAVVAPEAPRDSLVFAARTAGVFLEGKPLPGPLRGRLLRMPGLQDGSTERSLAELLPEASLRHTRDEITIGRGWKPRRGRRDCSWLPFVAPRSAGKTRVFVWPTLLAVGGVERNTIEIMRQLHHAYDFVVVTTDRLTEHNGSLHHQLKGLATSTYDLAECARHRSYLSMLATLKRVYAPDLVWICNGSSWQCEHAPAIRRLYDDVALVDQEVYDTRVGWINRYGEPGIQSFDRFVAINRRIYDAFVSRFAMDPARIDLIYHAVDGARFDPAAFPEEGISALKASHGLPPDRPLFTFIGRMVAQKRPLDFLRLVAALEATGEAASFLMLGDGELAGEVDDFIRERTRGAVKRLPFTDRVPEILAMTEGLVMTSEHEGLPVAMLEALAMGRPVLSTDVGDVRLILEEYGSGAIIPAIEAPDAVLAAWRAWRRDLPRYREAARRGAPRVRERFSSARVAARYEDCWRRAMATRNARP